MLLLAHVEQDVAKAESYSDYLDKLDKTQTTSILAIPLKHNELGTIGVLEMVNKMGGDKQFSPQDEEILRMVCSQLAIAIHSAQMNEKIAVERNNMQAVLNSITDLVLTLDRDGKLLICNHSLEKWLGISDQELRTRSYIDWLGKFNEEIAQDISFVYSNGTELDRKDYNLIRVETDGSTSVVGTVNYSINPLRDASEEDVVVKKDGVGVVAVKAATYSSSSSSSSSSSAAGAEENGLRGVVISLQDITPTKQLLKKMGAYVNEHLVQQIMSEGGASLGGKRCEAVCLFSDIRSVSRE